MENRIIELSEAQKELYRETAKTLKGYERRIFMARVVKSLGKGGQSQAKRELGWEATTALRDGLRESIDWYLRERHAASRSDHEFILQRLETHESMS